MLALIIYFFVELVIKFLVKNNFRFAFPKSFEFYGVVSILFVVGLYYLFIYLSKVMEFSPYYMNFNRFFTLFDPSNYKRFIANIAVIMFYYANPVQLFVGVPYSFYANYFQLNPLVGYKYVTSVVNAPHNYFFKFLYKYGLFSIIIFGLTAKSINKRLDYRNLSIFLVFLFYAVFLGTGFYEAYLFILIYLLDNNRVEHKKKESLVEVNV